MHMTPKLRAAALTLAALTVAASAAPTASPAATHPLGDAVVIKAGTIHLVEVGEIIRGGAVLVEDGKIVAIGPADTIEIPGGASVVDHGPDAVIVPGLVAVDSNYTQQTAGPRTADPTLLAIDQFDPYTPIVSALRSGITTVYLPPARGRLIAGQGAVVKTGGGTAVSADERILRERSGIHGSISSEARRTPGYWEPPVPATVDVGLGVPRPQLPTTTMGAVLAVDELMALAGGDEALVAEYGAQAGPALAAAMKDGATWRMGAARRPRAMATRAAGEPTRFGSIPAGNVATKPNPTRSRSATRRTTPIPARGGARRRSPRPSPRTAENAAGAPRLPSTPEPTPSAPPEGGARPRSPSGRRRTAAAGGILRIAHPETAAEFPITRPAGGPCTRLGRHLRSPFFRQHHRPCGTGLISDRRKRMSTA